jgi:acyl-CoA thioesterase
MSIADERYGQIRERILENNHFTRLLGIEIEYLEKDRAVLALELRKDLLNVQGVMHGGATASLVDTAVAIAIASTAGSGDKFTTVEMKINYLSPISSGRVKADAKLIRNGRRIIVAECDVFDSAEKLAAKALVTYIRID